MAHAARTLRLTCKQASGHGAHASRLARREDHHHLPPFKGRGLFDFRKALEIGFEPFEEFDAALLMGRFAAAELERDLHFIALFKKPLNGFRLNFVIMVINIWAHFYFFNLDDFLLFLRFSFFLLLLIFIFTEIEDLADGRLRAGRDFDEVEAGGDRDFNRLARRHHAAFFPILIDQQDLRDIDLLVDPGSVGVIFADGGLAKRSAGYRDSPLAASMME